SDNIDDTCRALEASQHPNAVTAAELEARRVIKECDAELANYRAALRSAPSDTVAQWIAETESRRKAAEFRLRQLDTGSGMTASEIRDVVERMHGIIAILDAASAEDRRKVYEAAQLSITYDHAEKRVKLHASPSVEPWSSVRVGGATLTQSTRAPWSVELVAA
ncbi:MAG: hypothetical protein ACR2QO_02780, partial [Acidimicrobiales bacterium]